MHPPGARGVGQFRLRRQLPPDRPPAREPSRREPDRRRRLGPRRGPSRKPGTSRRPRSTTAPSSCSGRVAGIEDDLEPLRATRSAEQIERTDPAATSRAMRPRHPQRRWWLESHPHELHRGRASERGTQAAHLRSALGTAGQSMRPAPTVLPRRARVPPRDRSARSTPTEEPGGLSEARIDRPEVLEIAATTAVSACQGHRSHRLLRCATDRC